MLSQKDFLDKKGLVCPNCEQKDSIHMRTPQVNEDGTIDIMIHCDNCRAIYREIYKLNGYYDFVKINVEI